MPYFIKINEAHYIMRKKKSESESTGPIRIVFFKGSQKPTSIQLTQKLLISLYTFVGCLIFMILFLLTLLIVTNERHTRLTTKYNTARKEVERLRLFIRETSPTAKIEELTEEKTEEDKNTSDKSEDTMPLVTESYYNDQEDNSAPEETTDENNSVKVEENPVPDDTEMKGEVSSFKAEISGYPLAYNFSYWIVNQSGGNARLEGRAIVILQTGQRTITYPNVQLKDGKVTGVNQGILFRIQHRKEMNGSITLPGGETKIIKTEIVLLDRKGNEITRQTFQPEAEQEP